MYLNILENVPFSILGFGPIIAGPLPLIALTFASATMIHFPSFAIL